MHNLRGIDLNLLVAFDALLSERNVTRAALRVGLSQPALSKALGRLREVFDDPLFERVGGLMEPTAQAVKIGRSVRIALDELQLVFDERHVPLEKSRERITIASTDFYDLILLPELLTRAALEAPGLELVVQRSDRIRVHGQFGAGEIDFAVMPIAESVTELASEPLFSDNAVTIMAANNPLREHLDLINFSDALHLTVALEGRGINWIDAALATEGLHRRIAVTLPSFLPAPFVIAASQLISTLPSRLVEKLGAAAGVIALPPPITAPSINICIAWHPRERDTTLRRWLRSTLREIAHAL
jgi:DNA-binding transcriptional LysR family regulator